MEELISDDVPLGAFSLGRRTQETRRLGRRRCRGTRLAWSDDEVGIVAKSRITAVGGMTAAAHGVVDDSAFEVRLMGGLAV